MVAAKLPNNIGSTDSSLVLTQLPHLDHGVRGLKDSEVEREMESLGASQTSKDLTFLLFKSLFVKTSVSQPVIVYLGH